MTRHQFRHCGAAVWWSLSRPSDPCWECQRPIGQDAPPRDNNRQDVYPAATATEGGTT